MSERLYSAAATARRLERAVPYPRLGLGKDLLELAILGVEHTNEEDPDRIGEIVDSCMHEYEGDAFAYEL